jgi:hypothetical protein
LAHKKFFVVFHVGGGRAPPHAIHVWQG